VTLTCSVPTQEGLAHIIANLRERDRREIYALRWDDEPEQLVADLVAYSGPLWRQWDWNGEPISIVGATPRRPGVAMVGAFGTELWPKAIRAMTAHVLRWLIPTLVGADYHRAEAYAMAANIDSRHWIEALGGKREAWLTGYGKGREDFILYTWSRDDVHEQRPRRRRAAAEQLHKLLDGTAGAGGSGASPGRD
jgi:RimJ/RimL family protein N-acetyltransferase